MTKRVTSASGRKWQRYNQWRSTSRKLDRARRLENAQAKAAVYVASYTVTKVRRPRRKAWAIVTIKLRDGRKSRMSIGETPWGLSISPTAAGKNVAQFLKLARATP